MDGCKPQRPDGSSCTDLSGVSIVQEQRRARMNKGAEMDERKREGEILKKILVTMLD